MQDANKISNFELRIAKPGTRPQGGSPKDNLKARIQESEFRIKEATGVEHSSSSTEF